jgi:two-component system cell cycle response regulator
VSSSQVPIRILLVSETREARRLGGLLDQETPKEFLILRAPGIEDAAKRLSRTVVDVVVLDIGSDRAQGLANIHATRNATPNLPLVVLSECDDDSLALESLQHGAQDFLSKQKLDRPSLIRSLRYAIERHRLHESAQSLSLLDDLTGLYNRRGFRLFAEQQLRLICREGAGLLLYLDLDDLKTINDKQGHLMGNQALMMAADILRACFRQSDIVARLGGDEFCVLVTNARRDTSRQVLRRLQQHVGFMNSTSETGFRLSFSVGIAEVPAGNSSGLEDLLRIADAMMYEQKRNKRAQLSFDLEVQDSPS